jgi:hypothetical protein
MKTKPTAEVEYDESLVGEYEQFVPVEDDSAEDIPDNYFCGVNDPLQDPALRATIEEAVKDAARITPTPIILWYNTNPETNAVFEITDIPMLSWILSPNAPKFVIDPDYKVVGKIVTKEEVNKFVPDPSVSFADVKSLLTIKDPFKMTLESTEECMD